MSNIIEVYPAAGKTVRTAPVWQYDYGQTLHVNGLELPASYKAEFSNTTRGDAIATVQSTDKITIPAQFLESGAGRIFEPHCRHPDRRQPHPCHGYCDVGKG